MPEAATIISPMAILAIQPGAIGDLILSLPALRWLRQRLGGSGMEVWAERANLPLVEHPAYSDGARPLAETGVDSYPLPARTLEALKSFELVVSWRGANLPELVAAVSAVHPRAYFLPQFPPPQPGAAVHLSDFRRAQLAALFGAEFQGAPEILLEPPDDDFARAYLAGELAGGEPLVVMHPGAGGKQKQWGAAQFAAVAGHLRRRWNSRVMFSEGPLDRKAVEAVRAAAPAPGARRISIDNMRHLAAVLRRCHLFIGNDTGITHLAAAVGLPTLAIFQASDPRVWAPRGRQVRVLEKPTLDQALVGAHGLAPLRLLRRNVVAERGQEAVELGGAVIDVGGDPQACR